MLCLGVCKRANPDPMASYRNDDELCFALSFLSYFFYIHKSRELQLPGREQKTFWIVCFEKSAHTPHQIERQHYLKVLRTLF